CDVHVAHLKGEKLVDQAIIANVRPLATLAAQSLKSHSIADEGLLDLLHLDVDGNGADELFFARRSAGSTTADSLAALDVLSQAGLKQAWSFTRPGHMLNLVQAERPIDGTPSFAIRDLTSDELLRVSAKAEISATSGLGKPGGFSTMPIVVDLDADGRNEIVVQNASGHILALEADLLGAAPRVRWTCPGLSMNRSPGYSTNGALCPQAADLDGDGLPEVLFAVEDAAGLAALRAVDGRGATRWTHSFSGCPWGGLQAGVNFWTFGRFAGRPAGADVYVDVHRRAKSSSEGIVLDGRTGELIWQQAGLVAEDAAMPFGGGLPAVADMNGDGADDLVQEFWTIYGAISGKDGRPLFPPASLPSPAFFGRWIAYSSPTVADLDGEGRLDVYLNSASYARGGYAAVHADGKPLWAEFHDNAEGSNGFGPVGDFDGDGALEIGVGVLKGTLACLAAATGARKWQVPASVSGDIVAADINADGIFELLYGGGDGKVHAHRGSDGHELWTVDCSGMPIVADVDGDGWVEIVAVGQDGWLRVIGNAK
ncbi:MAG TPA: hypothetical protein VFW87_26195, partial [Pirellulales bacterium]|nr:hypothetical protein [Pirellulales bacterium]